MAVDLPHSMSKKSTIKMNKMPLKTNHIYISP